MRIAWFSPLSIAKGSKDSLGAYVTDMLLPSLSQEHSIELFYDGFGDYPGIPTHHFLKATAIHSRDPFDLFFYQLEDRPDCKFVRMHLALKPGVVWFHDFVFSNYGPEPILNSPWQEVVSRFNAGGNVWPERGAEFNQLGPLAHRESAFSGVALFSEGVAHSQYLGEIECALKGTNDRHSYRLPIPVADEVQAIDLQAWHGGVVAFCGSPRIEHRAHKILQALSDVSTDYKLRWLLNPSEKDQAEELLREFEIDNVVLVLGRRAQAWQEIIAKSDLAVHSSFSVFGHLSPYMQMSLCAGLPTVLTNFGAVEFLPDDLVFKVAAGEHEALQLREVLAGVLKQELRIDRSGIRNFAIELHSCQAVAGELDSLFRAEQDNLAKLLSKWEVFEQEAQASLLEEVDGLIGGRDLRTGQAESICSGVFRELGWSD